MGESKQKEERKIEVRYMKPDQEKKMHQSPLPKNLTKCTPTALPGLVKTKAGGASA